MLKTIGMSAVEIALYAAIGFTAASLLGALTALIGSPSESGAINFARSRLRDVGPIGFFLGIGIGCLLILKRNTRKKDS